jgi:phage terminase Nu1 subunit (DNA packaging protein)
MSELVSLRKGARALGMALSTLQHHIAKGNVRLIDGKVDVDVARIQLSKNVNVEQSIKGQQNVGRGDSEGSVGAGEGSGGSLWAAKERSERARAELMELELAEKQGRLVDADVVRRETMAKARIARDALMSLPTRVSAELAAETDAGKVHDRLSVEIRKICAELAAGESGQTTQ